MSELKIVCVFGNGAVEMGRKAGNYHREEEFLRPTFQGSAWFAVACWKKKMREESLCELFHPPFVGAGKHQSQGEREKAVTGDSFIE